MLHTTRYNSPVGTLHLLADEAHLRGLWIEGQKYFPEDLQTIPAADGTHPVLSQTCAWLDRYFSGKRPSPEELPLEPEGSPFRRIIWKELCLIPSGSVVTYRDLAGRAARILNRKSMSAQAVGGAVGHNPISIIIPCHRVVGADGSLTGYAGGLDRKEALLQLEGVDIRRFHRPGEPLCRKDPEPPMPV